MKKSTKVLSAALSALMVSSTVAAGAAMTANAADESKYIYFEVPTLEEWGTTKNVYCHLYAVYGNKTALVETSWQTKKEQCKAANDEKTLYYFDTAKLGEIEEGADYALLFSTKDIKGVAHQTGNITFGAECLGDTVYLTGGMVENTEDSEKLDYEGAWRKNSEKFGAKKGITSTAKLVGKYFPMHQPRAQMLAIALKQYLLNPINEPFFNVENNLALCEQLETTPLEVYRQYESDYADLLTAGDKDTPTLASVQEHLGLTDEDLNPTTPSDPTDPTTPSDPSTPVNPSTTGDINGDSTVDAKDRILITRYLAKWAGYGEDKVDLAAADVNHDGGVDAKDRIKLTRYLAKWKGYETLD